MDRCDVIIIGAGINGLVSATCLARAGKSVIVLRAAGSNTADYSAGWKGADGFMFPTPASRLENFPLHIVHKLGLEDYGLRPASATPAGSALITSAGDALVRDRDHGNMDRRLRATSSREADAYAAYISVITRQKRHLDRFLDLNGGAVPPHREMLKLLATAGQDHLWEATHLALSSVKDVLDRHFQSEALKTLIFASTLGGYFGGMGLGPFAPTGGTGLLMDPLSLTDRQHTGSGTLGAIEGGGQALLDVLHRAAVDQGVTFVDDTEVSEITHEKGEVRGVALEGGQFIETSTLIGDIDLKVFFLAMFAWKALPHELVLSVAASRNRALVAQVNLVLDGEPQIEGLPENFLQDGSPLYLMDSLRDVERAHDAWALGAIPQVPPVEFIFYGPGAGRGDDPDARHYATAFVYYTPGELADGKWTDEKKIRLISNIVNRLVAVSPGFEKRLIDAKLVLPVDYEDRFGLIGGHLHGGNTALDQTLFNRPNPDIADGNLPLKGLYLAGPGTSQAPFLSGEAGLDVAKRILREPQPNDKTEFLPVQWARALASRVRVGS